MIILQLGNINVCLSVCPTIQYNNNNNIDSSKTKNDPTHSVI